MGYAAPCVICHPYTPLHLREMIFPLVGTYITQKGKERWKKKEERRRKEEKKDVNIQGCGSHLISIVVQDGEGEWI